MKKIIWALTVLLMMGACTAKPVETKEPPTTDVSSSVFTKASINYDAYKDDEPLVFSQTQLDEIASLVQLESWTPIFKPVYAYKIGFVLFDASLYSYAFGIYNNKLLVGVTMSTKSYFFEGPKAVYTQIKSKLEGYALDRLALPEYRNSVFVKATAKNEAVYPGWLSIDLNGKVDLGVLEHALQRDAWYTKQNMSATTEMAFELFDTEGRLYRFSGQNGTRSQVEIYEDPLNGGDPVAIYIVPMTVIQNVQALLQPLVATEPLPDSVKNAVFVKAYLDMWLFYNFETEPMLSDYGYTFTASQKTTFNAIFDPTKWIKLNNPVYSNDSFFTLIDAQGNIYHFATDDNLVIRIPKDKPETREAYVTPVMDVWALYNELLEANPVKGVLPIVKTASFVSVYERSEATEYQLVSKLTASQSNHLIDVLAYSSWKQKVGMPAGGWWFKYKVVTSTGLSYYLGFDLAIVDLPDGSNRIYTLPSDVTAAIETYIESLK